jgi:hypothetical protein
MEVDYMVILLYRRPLIQGLKRGASNSEKQKKPHLKHSKCGFVNLYIHSHSIVAQGFGDKS